ncbi:hypothetical protein PENTCL1PPCAC_20191, partial [Pristionchus entomophagus]
RLDDAMPYCIDAGRSTGEEAAAFLTFAREKIARDYAGPDPAHAPSIPKWDCLIITANDEQQKRIFELQLVDVPWRDYANKCFVVADPPGVRAGSGGASIWVLKQNREHKYFDSGDKVYLIHSGGQSKQAPHHSTGGKIFMTMPDGEAILRWKLNGYKSLPPLLRPGIFIDPADALVSLPDDMEPIGADTHLFLPMHRSNGFVAINQGVFFVNKRTGELERIVQKPQKKVLETEMSASPAAGAWFFTTAACFISASCVRRLDQLVVDNCPVEAERCIFGDFLRSVGSKGVKEPEGELDFDGLDLEEMRSRYKTHRWNLCLESCFRDAKIQLIDCDAQSFYHFGTIEEAGMHLNYLSRAVLKIPLLPLNSTWAYKVGYKERRATKKNEYSIVECCNLPSNPHTVVGHSAVVSNCYVGRNKNGQKINIPDEVVVYSTPVDREGRKGWVTVVVGKAEDLTKSYDRD